MKRNFLIRIFILLLSVCLSLSACDVQEGQAPDNENINESHINSAHTDGERSDEGQNDMTDSVSPIMEEFKEYVDVADKFPVSFVYGNRFYDGLAGFDLTGVTKSSKDDKLTVNISYLHPDKKLKVDIEAALYEKYNAYEWTVYFTNVGSENSAIISDLWGADLTLKGENAELKTNKGDYGGYFEPYAKDITTDGVEIVANTGRSTEQHMPYFNVETDDGGTMMAIGWSGTWTAQFKKEDDGTHIRAKGTNNLSTYLKPGETVRTPLMAFVRYYERNEDIATNSWRRWYVNCVMPRDSWFSKEPLSAATVVSFFSDTGKGWYRGGSEYENYTTWRASVDAVKERNLKFDYHLFDAGWYHSPTGASLGDSWFSVGSWDLDTTKWPGDTFKEYTTAVKRELNIRGTEMWFEVERFNGAMADFKRNYGLSASWYLPAQGENYLLWHGDPEVVEWLFHRITYVMDKCGIYIYREDHNFSPISAFLAGDTLQGENRNGITENLHFQGKYKLWERILAWQKQTGRASFIEMQSAGGNRQDLALLKYAVSFFRSDSDITLNPPATVSKINALNKWLPYGGVLFGKLSDTDAVNPRTKFQWRSTYSSQLGVMMQFQNMTDETWELIADGLQEYERYKEFVFADFYELTERKPLYATDKWVSRMYFDPDTDRGVFETFCFKNCNEGRLTVKLRGLNPKKWYRLEDPDGKNGVELIKGQDLLDGYTVYLTPNSSSIMWITPASI